MKNVIINSRTELCVNTSKEGERLEVKVDRMINGKETPKETSPLIYTPRSEGVQPKFDIRTDRWEEAIDAMDKVTKSYTARRTEKADSLKKAKEKENVNDESAASETESK